MSAFDKRDDEQWIEVWRLIVYWTGAQREVADRQVKYIADNFDADLFGTIIVSKIPEKPGYYHIHDGQRRVAAAKLLFGPNEKVPCTEVDASSAQRSAEVFIGFNGDRRTKPTSIEMFRVCVTAGLPVATEVDSIVSSLGLKIGPSVYDGMIRGTSALLAIHKQHGPERLRETLLLIRSIWGFEATAYDSAILLGTALFLPKIAEEGLEQRKLIPKLQKKLTPGRVIAGARATRDTSGGSIPKAVCRVLLETALAGTRRTRTNGSVRPSADDDDQPLVTA